MHTLPIELVQNTPILHFQSELAGDGATLRATELKPKLDRYLNAKYKDKILAEWKIKDTDALNYKLRITPSHPSIVDNNIKPSMFFGQGKKPVLLKRKQDTLTVQIFCLIPGLSELLQSVDWKNFFLVTNFGTRQSKGYGSFFPVTTLETFAPKDMIGKEIKTDKSVTYRVDSYFTTQAPTWEGVMNEINDVYKCLRSGINEDGIYFKSLMFAYAKSNGQWWDKRVIKELFFPEKLKEHRDKPKNKNRTEPDPLAEQPRVTSNLPFYPMFRDNLGLATVENWEEYRFKVKKKGPEDVARFKSPILFKPLCIKDQWYVFILHREIPSKFKNATFTVRKDNTLRFRTQNDFSMKEFLNYVFEIEDYGTYMPKKGNRDRSTTILENLKEIKKHFKRIE